MRFPDHGRVASVLGVLAAVLLTGGPALAGGEGGHGFSLKEHGFYIVNFIIFAGLIWSFARKPIAEMTARRSDLFGQRLEEAGRRHREATATLADVEQKMGRLEVTRREMIERLVAEGEKLTESIARRAEEEEGKIRQATERALTNEKSKAIKAFQAELAMQALARAEEGLKGRWRTLPHDRLVEQFVAGAASTEERQ